MRLAILTGGSRGLGLALCHLFSAQGFRVIEFSRSAPHAFSVRVDLSAPDESRKVVKEAIASLGNVPLEEIIVVNNAGTLDPIGPAHRKVPAEIAANLNTNFNSAILSLTEIVGHFQSLPSRKVLANITSGAALTGYPGWSLYCAAKAGMEVFIQAVAREQEAEPQPFIPVNIDPGLVDTDMQARIRAASAFDFPDVERFVEYEKRGSLIPASLVATAVYRILQTSSLSFGGRYHAKDFGAPGYDDRTASSEDGVGRVTTTVDDIGAARS